MPDLEKDLVHLVRLALDGRSQDVAALARRSLRSVAERRPDLVDEITMVLRSTSAVTRQAVPESARSAELPVDLDSRLELLRRENHPHLAFEPTWPHVVGEHLRRVLLERERERELNDAGLTPTKSMLFVGPPGVGKTLAARWLASRIGMPLLVLDLSAVMSSFLGRTGGNIRTVLDYAQSFPSVLLLDEFDAIAKRRDDSGEIGELKRLVTVLLQSVDDWPAHSILIAATNHPELLDPAVWRRFEHVVRFPLPTADDIRDSIATMLHDDAKGLDASLLGAALVGRSFADITRLVTAARREAVLFNIAPADAVCRHLSETIRDADKPEKLKLASELARNQKSQREISTITGLSRDTLRKHLKPGEGTSRKRR
jgi:SpoVK/Ycf46/Vps4 family AAA+-type ATPase